MVAAALGMWLLAQQIQVSARVTPDQVLLGDSVVFSITVRTRGDQPVQIVNPSFNGLEIQASREQTQVTLDAGEAARITRRDLTLRTLRAGTITIGPVRVRQGDETSETAPVTLEVSAAGAAGTNALSGRIRGLVARAPPPRLGADEVGATVLVSDETILLGQQLDLVVIAWFPRSIRARLRNPPTLRPPQLQGAWSYQRPSPAGIALSRRVGGLWYDLFVHHQAVFPLSAGAAAIGGATVSYSLPLTYSFLSRELRHEVETSPLSILVRDLPPPPATAFHGAAGVDLSLEVAGETSEIPRGGAIQMAATVSGIGNVALWPEPEIAFPPGLRVYPGDVEVSLTAENGRLGGSKTFHYLAVGDSVGTFRVPATSYAYFDTDRGRYRLLESPAWLVAVTGRTGAPLVEARGVTLMGPRRGARVDAALRRASPAIWLFLLLVPPLVVLGLRITPRLWARWRAARTERRRSSEDGLTRLDWEFDDVLGRLVADASTRDGDELADALRAAGVEAPVASHAARVRDRLRLARYGPVGATDTDELTAEVQEVLRALMGSAPRSRRASVVGSVAVVLMLGWVPSMHAQAAETLFEAGAVRAAADSFARRASTDPVQPAHWYNLGSARYRLGDRSGALAAWVRAARLAPRDASVNRSLTLVPAPDPLSAQLTWVSPITPVEAAVAASACWLLAWILIVRRTRRRYVVPLLAAAMGLAAYGVWVQYRYDTPLAVAAVDGGFRAAPFGSAPVTRGLAEGAVVQIVDRWGEWVLVGRGTERGWVLRRELTSL